MNEITARQSIANNPCPEIGKYVTNVEHYDIISLVNQHALNSITCVILCSKNKFVMPCILLKIQPSDEMVNPEILLRTRVIPFGPPLRLPLLMSHSGHTCF